MVLERQHVVKALYDNLPNKSKIVTSKKVISVLNKDQGVEVETDDKMVYKGDIVIGCDGVNSIVRDFMWDNANTAKPGFITGAEQSCEFTDRSMTDIVDTRVALATTYSCLIGFAPQMAGVGMGDCQTVHNKGFSFLIITQPGRTFFFVFIKLPKVVHWPDRLRYTAEDAEREAAKLAALPVTESLLFGEIWKRRVRGQLIPLEEVVFEHWHSGRIAILGDSAHKVR